MSCSFPRHRNLNSEKLCDLLIHGKAGVLNLKNPEHFSTASLQEELLKSHSSFTHFCLFLHSFPQGTEGWIERTHICHMVCSVLFSESPNWSKQALVPVGFPHVLLTACLPPQLPSLPLVRIHSTILRRSSDRSSFLGLSSRPSSCVNTDVSATER